MDESVYLDNVDIKNVPADVKANMVEGDGYVNVTDPNFEMPSDLRMSLAIEHTFDLPVVGDGFVASAEFIHVQKQNDVQWVDLARREAGSTSDGGRVIYEPVDPLTGERTDRYDLMLTNADKGGESNIFTTSLFKAWDSGLTVNMSYTNQDITEGNPGSSSTASSNYRYVPVVDRNEVVIGRSDYEVEHRFVMNLGYNTEFISGYATKFNLFFERRSGTPFSWTMGAFRDGDLGDQRSFNSDSYYLPYIPTGASDGNVVFDGSLTHEQFMEWAQVAGLTQYAGGYAPKNASRTPWVTRIDLHVEQEIPGLMSGHKGAVYFDIKNLLNLIDSDKGYVLDKQYSNQVLVDYDIDEQGRHVYSAPYGGFDRYHYDQVQVEDSAWLIKAGVRYQF